jgi:hypothetical protein
MAFQEESDDTDEYTAAMAESAATFRQQLEQGAKPFTDEYVRLRKGLQFIVTMGDGPFSAQQVADVANRLLAGESFSIEAD